MWPYLLELVNDEAYNRAILVLLRCIATLANEKREEKAADYALDFDSRQDLPRPQAILARLVCLLSEPYRGRDIGLVVCRAMLGLGPLIHPSVGDYWAEAVPALQEYLEAHSEATLVVSKWQDSLLKLWRETVSRVKEQKWLQELVERLLEQFRLYRLPATAGQQQPQHDSSVHRCLHRYVGFVLSRVDSKAVVDKALDSLWQQVNHRADSERLGFAQGQGLAAAAHIDAVLTKLSDRISKKEKKSGFFANLLKGQQSIAAQQQLTAAAHVRSHH
jgi:hypothetical protein